MSTNKTIIRVEENGVEYFTHAATGESGLSTSGMAKSLGVSQPAITQLDQLIQNSVISNDLPESLQPLWGKTYQLEAKYKNIKIYSSLAWSCFAEYYAFESKKRTSEAIAVFRAFARIGAESFIQGKTGWLPGEYQSSESARSSIDRILDTPDPWVKMYQVEFCKRVYGWFGAQFYWSFCYCWMTDEEKCKVNRLNPDRHEKIHQYIEPETKLRLSPRIHELNALVGSSRCKQDFLVAYGNLYGEGWQQDLGL